VLRLAQKVLLLRRTLSSQKYSCSLILVQLDEEMPYTEEKNFFVGHSLQQECAARGKLPKCGFFIFL
jgi:hypothetical protein